MSERRIEWDKHGIKAEIHRRGETLSGLAIKNNLPEASVRVSLDRPFPKADRIIARFLDLSLHDLWPDRYDDKNKRFTFVNKTSRFATNRTSQKRKPVSDRKVA